MRKDCENDKFLNGPHKFIAERCKNTVEYIIYIKNVNVCILTYCRQKTGIHA